MRGRWLGSQWALIRYIAGRFWLEGFADRAAGLTFTTLLALVPLLTISFAILRPFPVSQKLSEDIQDFIFANFVPASGQVVQRYLQDFINQAAHLSAFGLIFLMVASILLLITIEKTFNGVWQVQGKFRGITSFLKYWAILTLAPVFLGLSFAASSYVLSFFYAQEAIAPALDYLLQIAPFLLGVMGFILLYMVVPNTSVSFRHALIGGIFSALVFELIKRGFILYLTLFPTYEFLYGALATIPIFLLWIYLCWLNVLLGALFTYSLSLDFQHQTSSSHEPFITALLVLEQLHHAQLDAKPMMLTDLQACTPLRNKSCLPLCVQKLLDRNYISQTNEGGFILLRDLYTENLWDFYQTLSWPIPGKRHLEILNKTGHTVLKKTLENLDSTIHDAMNIKLINLFEEKQSIKG